MNRKRYWQIARANYGRCDRTKEKLGAKPNSNAGFEWSDAVAGQLTKQSEMMPMPILAVWLFGWTASAFPTEIVFDSA